MIHLAVRQLLRALVTLALLMSVVFVVLRTTGDPALLMMSTDAPPKAVEAFRIHWGLDRPLWYQYFVYMSGLLHGDFGQSMRDGRQALALVVERVPATLAITIPAFFIKLFVGLPAGVTAALHRGSVTDRLTMTTAVVGHTIPSFVLALVLVLVFAVQLHWLPSSGAKSWYSAILPIVTLALPGAAVVARFTRSAVIEVLNQPYVRAATAKGIPWRRVVSRHVLPNAAIPVVTIVGFMVGSLMAGTIIVETVFAWPGVGLLLIGAVANRDIAVVQGILFFVGISMVTANLVVDFVYGWIDPRMRMHAIQTEQK